MDRPRATLALAAACFMGSLPLTSGCAVHDCRQDCQARYYNHPRFHPVPTQPAFMPRAEDRMAMADVAYPGQVQGDAVGMPAVVPDGAARPCRPINAPPEVIPIPSPLQKGVEEPAPGPPVTSHWPAGRSPRPETANSPAGPPDWIFAPPLTCVARKD
jgi:hypothetical protein